MGGGVAAARGSSKTNTRRWYIGSGPLSLSHSTRLSRARARGAAGVLERANHPPRVLRGGDARGGGDSRGESRVEPDAEDRHGDEPAVDGGLSNPSRRSSRAGPGLFRNQRFPLTHFASSSRAPSAGIGNSETPSGKSASASVTSRATSPATRTQSHCVQLTPGRVRVGSLGYLGAEPPGR